MLYELKLVPTNILQGKVITNNKSFQHFRHIILPKLKYQEMFMNGFPFEYLIVIS